MIYSYSRLKRYADCPASFQYKYLYEMPESPTEPLVLGKTVHAAIQKYLIGTDMQTAVDSAMIQEGDLSIERDEVIRMVQHPIVAAISGGQVEERLAIALDDGGLINFQGYIDWWRELPDGSVQLIDWKTNRVKYKPKENYQLGLYAWYLSQITGEKEINAELVFLRYPYAESREIHKYTVFEMEEARKWALQLAEEIEEKVAEVNMLGGSIDDDKLFPATPGKHCQYCSHASLCIKSVNVEPVRVDDKADAERVAAEVIRLEAALDVMKNRLKEWAMDNGSIAVGDSIFDFVPSVSWKIGAEKLYELCAELHDAGIDVFEYLTLTASNLRKMGIDEVKLATYGKKKITKTFRLVKDKEAC